MKKVLLLGGKSRKTNELLALSILNGDDITLAFHDTKVKNDISLLPKVKIIYLDRHNISSIKAKLENHFFDVVYDFSSVIPKSVDYLLSVVKTSKYIFVSTFEIYSNGKCGLNNCENDILLNDTVDYEIKVGDKDWYARGKYNCELLLKHKYNSIPSVIVRTPFEMSECDDFEDKNASRLMKYVEAIIKRKPINGDDFLRKFNFVESKDLSDFVVCLANSDYIGIVNFASQGNITIDEVISYIEKKTGISAKYSTNVEKFPFSVHQELTMNLDKCLSIYTPKKLEDWIYKKIDRYIEYINEKNSTNLIEKRKIQNWLVTGGSTGFGRYLVLKLHELGYNVVATSRSLDKLNDLPNDIVKIELDVRDICSCKLAVEHAVNRLGSIDVLVNNAGLSHISTFEETPNDIAENIIDTNYWGVANMMKSVIPYMRKQKNGTVVNISSASGFRPRNYGSYYVASKFAVESITKNLKFECQNFMRVMSIEFGGLNTGLGQRQTVIHTKFDEYKNLPSMYSVKKGYSNKISKSVDTVIDIVNT